MSSHLSEPAGITASIVGYSENPEQLLAAIQSCLSAPIKVDLTMIDNSPGNALRRIVKDLNVSYIASPRNLGFGTAHNIALRESLNQSKYHLVLNPDVRFDSQVLPALYDFMEAAPEVGLVMPRVLYPDNREQRLCKLLPTPLDLILRRFGGKYGAKYFQNRISRYLLANADLSLPRMVPSLSGCFMFLRTEVLREVGVFDEQYFMYMEDVDLCRRIGAVSKTVFFPEVSIYHEYHKGSYRDVALLKRHLISAFRYFQKWGWLQDRERDLRNSVAFDDETATLRVETTDHAG